MHLNDGYRTDSEPSTVLTWGARAAQPFDYIRTLVKAPAESGEEGGPPPAGLSARETVNQEGESQQ